MKGNFSLFHLEKYKDTNNIRAVSASGIRPEHLGRASLNFRQALIVATF
jgi:hypothetical protein